MKLRSYNGAHIVTERSGNKIVFNSLSKALEYIWENR